jgi:hypothetical protein
MRNIIILLFSIFLFSFSNTEKKIETDLDILVNQWHQDASVPNFDAYFGFTTDDFVFLGTADGERWNKEDFKLFCKPYFDKGKAWDFKVKDRNWVFSKNRKMVWFDETLDTWMTDCRGSGILIKKGKKWKLAYYNLTVLIENEKIQSFILLRNQSIE